jgi:hypothetical protein
MKVLNDYYCPSCGRTKEHFVENSVMTVSCHSCSEPATKVRAVPNFMLPGNDPAGFPTAADKWVKKREEKRQQELKADPSAGL